MKVSVGAGPPNLTYHVDFNAPGLAVQGGAPARRGPRADLQRGPQGPGRARRDFIQIEDLGAWMLALDDDERLGHRRLNAWIDGRRREDRLALLPRRGLRQHVPRRRGRAPARARAVEAVNVEQFALDFALRDMVDVKALEVVGPRPRGAGRRHRHPHALHRVRRRDRAPASTRCSSTSTRSGSTFRPTAASRRCRGSAPTRSCGRCRAPPPACARRSGRRRPPPRSPDVGEPVPAAAVAVAAPVSARAVMLAALPAGELVLDAVELGRRAVQPPAVAQQREERERAGPRSARRSRSRRPRIQIAVQIAKGMTAPPLCWSSRRWSSARRCATAACSSASVAGRAGRSARSASSSPAVRAA